MYGSVVPRQKFLPGSLPPPSSKTLKFIANCRLSVESHEDSLATTPFSSGPQDFKELFMKLTATQRQLIRAREVIQKKEGAVLGMKVLLSASI